MSHGLQAGTTTQFVLIAVKHDGAYWTPRTIAQELYKHKLLASPTEAELEAFSKTVLEGLVGRAAEKFWAGDAGRAGRVGIRRLDLLRAQRQLFEKDQRRHQFRAKRRRPPIRDDCLPDLVSERIRRNCAVGPRSERALAEQRRERREQLAFSGAPLRRAAHRGVEGLRERSSEELGAVHQRLH